MAWADHGSWARAARPTYPIGYVLEHRRAYLAPSKLFGSDQSRPQLGRASSVRERYRPIATSRYRPLTMPSAAASLAGSPLSSPPSTTASRPSTALPCGLRRRRRCPPLTQRLRPHPLFLRGLRRRRQRRGNISLATWSGERSGEVLWRAAVAGLVSIQPFFGGVEASPSEKRFDAVPLGKMELFEWMYVVDVPAGSADRDHEPANGWGVGVGG
ncbi:hypothetical protein Cni_G18275 [Canna indica]|uniref:Uncharacterized protein n=1 Tax=Canna indica TaxID=4628 RepID=A0AAQ3KJ16_9LILI|nr:hypothetical protein Cni_G18275 [Canna indica]